MNDNREKPTLFKRYLAWEPPLWLRILIIVYVVAQVGFRIFEKEPLDEGASSADSSSYSDSGSSADIAAQDAEIVDNGLTTDGSIGKSVSRTEGDDTSGHQASSERSKDCDFDYQDAWNDPRCLATVEREQTTGRSSAGTSQSQRSPVNPGYLNAPTYDGDSLGSREDIDIGTLSQYENQPSAIELAEERARERIRRTPPPSIDDIRARNQAAIQQRNLEEQERREQAEARRQEQEARREELARQRAEDAQRRRDQEEARRREREERLERQRANRGY